MTIRLRPEVRRFAELMEEALRENDHKGGWDGCDTTYLLARLRQEVAELEDAISYLAMPAELYVGPYRQRFLIQGEAADVANFAMMLACNDGHLMKVKK